MNKKLIPFAALALFSTVAMTSCGGKSYEKGVDLNYTLLIGQIDHNDSAARTRGIREALGTRVDKDQQKVNPNAEKAKQGKLTIGGKEYRVNELESMEQKNTSGATWDQATATSTAQTWINKYANTTWKKDGKEVKEQGITFFVSNNDGMAEGAIGADNWPTGMPIWGYDSNASTLEFIKQGKIMGTVNQNAPGQAAAIYMVARNAIDGVAPDQVTKKGFTEAGDWGKLTSEYAYKADQKALLALNVAVTKDNVEEYMKPIAEQVDKGVSKKADAGAKAKIWQSYYSATDTFLKSSMRPLFNEYKELFNFDVTIQEGDGNDEAQVLNKLEAAPKDMDAYIINMVKTTSTNLYLDKLAKKLDATEAKPTDVPVIFWNRQGTNDDGSVDTNSMADKRFKYIYYVGFDANQGGDIQGEMIVDYITDHIADLTK